MIILCFIVKLIYLQENMLTMEQRINRIKVVLAEKQRTNKWLAENLGNELCKTLHNSFYVKVCVMKSLHYIF